MKHRRMGGALVALLALSLVSAACGSDDDGARFRRHERDRTRLSGSITISGSSTVEPISSLVAESSTPTTPTCRSASTVPGTGDGFELFCKGETDISDASRPIEDEEAKACQKAGIEYIGARDRAWTASRS